MHSGPLSVQRRLSRATRTATLICITGGWVGGDRLAVNVDVDPRAHALLTTPAATKLYRSAGACSLIQQTLRAAGDALLEWLPQETIVFSGAIADVRTRIELSGSARFIGWEISCLGRPAAAERFDRGELGQRIELVRDGKLVYSERASYLGGAPVLAAPWGLRGEPVVGTLLCAGVDLGDELERLREVMQRSVLAGRAATMRAGDRRAPRSAAHRAVCFLCASRAPRPRHRAVRAARSCQRPMLRKQRG